MLPQARRVLATFGCGDCGRLGLGVDSLLSQEVPHVVRALLDTQLHHVACGGAHTAAVAEDGSLFTFGLNDRAQLGHSPHEREVHVPQEVAMPEVVTAVAVSGRCCVIMMRCLASLLWQPELRSATSAPPLLMLPAWHGRRTTS